jgi:hypothetical protein
MLFRARARNIKRQTLPYCITEIPNSIRNLHVFEDLSPPLADRNDIKGS